MTPRRRRVVISDPKDIAALVLETPGLADKLGDAMADVLRKRHEADESEVQAARACIKRTLAEMAPGWALDNFGEPYPTSE